jgi:hypothetical protein
MMQKVSQQIFLMVLLVLVGTSYMIQAAPSQPQESNGFLNRLTNNRQNCGDYAHFCGYGRPDCCPGFRCYHYPGAGPFDPPRDPACLPNLPTKYVMWI